MRAMFLVVGSLLLCAGLFGCDNRPQATVSAPVAVTAPPQCNCNQQPPQAAPAPAVHVARSEHRTRHEDGSRYAEGDRHAEGGGRVRHHRHTVEEFERMYPGYGENDADYSGPRAMHGTLSTMPPPPPPRSMTEGDDEGAMRRAAWIDGYGRAHYTSDDASQDENPARLSGYEHNVRSDPYRGWNSDCDQRDVVN